MAYYNDEQSGQQRSPAMMATVESIDRLLQMNNEKGKFVQGNWDRGMAERKAGLFEKKFEHEQYTDQRDWKTDIQKTKYVAETAARKEQATRDRQEVPKPKDFLAEGNNYLKTYVDEMGMDTLKPEEKRMFMQYMAKAARSKNIRTTMSASEVAAAIMERIKSGEAA
jgi:hypothetical protein